MIECKMAEKDLFIDMTGRNHRGRIHGRGWSSNCDALSRAEHVQHGAGHAGGHAPTQRPVHPSRQHEDSCR